MARWQNLLAPPQPTFNLYPATSSIPLDQLRYKSTNPSMSKQEGETSNNNADRVGKMKPIDDKKDTVTIRAVSRNEEGRKRVEKMELDTHNMDTLKYVEKKLEDKGVQRMERHPANGLGIRQPPPKSGRGGKYTWEGPGDLVESELNAAPPAIDEKDPNYVDEEAVAEGESDVAGEYVVGEDEVAKAAEDTGGVGVARLEVDPHLKQT